MGSSGSEHNPLIGGIKFSAGQLRPDGSVNFNGGGGTLTGVARSRWTPSQRYLVGCLHSFVPGTPTDDYGVPGGKIFQPSLTPDDEVGTVDGWYPVYSSRVNTHLYKAVMSGDIGTVRALLYAGAKPTSSDADMARGRGQNQLARLIEDAKPSLFRRLFGG